MRKGDNNGPFTRQFFFKQTQADFPLKKISLTGIKPTGAPHLGSYLGAIKPAIELAKTHEARYFIADYHALTSVRDKNLMKEQVYGLAATWLAAGLDPDKVIFYRQSDIPEVFEPTSIPVFDNFTRAVKSISSLYHYSIRKQQK